MSALQSSSSHAFPRLRWASLVTGDPLPRAEHPYSTRPAGSAAGASPAVGLAPAPDLPHIVAIDCSSVRDVHFYSYDEHPALAGVPARAYHGDGHTVREALLDLVMREDDNSRARVPDG